MMTRYVDRKPFEKAFNILISSFAMSPLLLISIGVYGLVIIDFQIAFTCLLLGGVLSFLTFWQFYEWNEKYHWVAWKKDAANGE